MSILKTVDHVTSDLTRMRYLFVNLYFLGTADCWVLVDAGLPGSAGAIIKAAEDRYGRGTKPNAIIMTHAHFDHRGALPDLLRHWTVPVYAHPDEMPYLEGQISYPSPDPTVGKGMMAAMSLAYPSRPIDIRPYLKHLPDDQTVPFMPGWQWVHTPGHTAGHVSFFRAQDGCLIAGDAFVTTQQESLIAVAFQKRGVFGPPAYFTPDWIKARDSVVKLRELQPEIAATGHGVPLRGVELKNGLENLVRHFDTVAVPKHGRYVPHDRSKVAGQPV